MTLRHLRIFREVCEQKSVTKAAKKLFISQPSVSVVIADMEKKYNVKLFMRIHNRLVITEEGQELYTRACNVLNNFDDFETLAFENSNSNCVKIGTSLTIGTFLLPSLLKRIQTLFPQAQLKVKIFPKDKIESLLLQGELDFGLIENSVKYPELTAIQFYEDKLVAVCSPQFAVGDTLNVQELEKYPLLLREKGSATRDFFDSYLHSCGIEVFPFIETSNPQAALRCAKEGLGIAILPHSMVHDALQDNSLRAIALQNVTLKRLYFFAFHKQKIFSPLQEQIFSACKEFFAI